MLELIERLKIELGISSIVLKKIDWVDEKGEAKTKEVISINMVNTEFISLDFLSHIKMIIGNPLAKLNIICLNDVLIINIEILTIDTNLEDYTCHACPNKMLCPYVYDSYNINGDCLAMK